MKKIHTLIEMARDLGVSIEELIQHAAFDDLTVFVVAQEWPASSTNGLEDTVLVGPVNLVPSDLIQSLSADHTMVRQVTLRDSDNYITLSTPQEVRRGAHFVTADELIRFGKQLGDSEAVSELSRPPYLDPTHQYYSPDLHAAVNAWLAQYASDGYKAGRGHLQQIHEWLLSNFPDLSPSARNHIAGVVNPNKKGGRSKGK